MTTRDIGLKLGVTWYIIRTLSDGYALTRNFWSSSPITQLLRPVSASNLLTSASIELGGVSVRRVYCKAPERLRRPKAMCGFD